MLNHRFSPIDRRGFLLLVRSRACSAPPDATRGGEPQAVTTPPTVKGGARSRLMDLEQKGKDAAAKTPKKNDRRSRNVSLFHHRPLHRPDWAFPDRC